MSVEHVTIPARFNGPPATANGGYACGLVASAIGPSATVRLTAPPPLDVPLVLRRDNGAARLFDGETLIAEGGPGAPAGEVRRPPAFDEAARAAEGYAGRDPDDHV